MSKFKRLNFARGAIFVLLPCALLATATCADAGGAKKPLAIPERSQAYEAGMAADAQGKKDEARAHFESGAEAGDPWCMNALGMFYGHGWGGLDRDADRAFELIAHAAAMNQPIACRNLGLIYLNGDWGVGVNTKKAIDYLGLAAKLGDTEAELTLARLYLNGEHVAKNKKKGLAFLNAASETDDPALQNDLGVFCLEGRYGVPVDEEKGLALVRKSAERNFPAAVFNMASYYLEGKYGLPEDEKKGLELLIRAAEMNQPNALCMLGSGYFFGLWGLDEDGDKGIELITRSAEMDYPRALNVMAALHLEGMFGFSRDVKKGLALAERAASMGDPDALYALGCWNLEGKYGLAPDMDKAIRFFTGASDLGDVKSLAMLGFIATDRESDLVTNASISKGEEMLRRAWKQNPDACRTAYTEYAGWKTPRREKTAVDAAIDEMHKKFEIINVEMKESKYRKNKFKSVPDYVVDLAAFLKESEENPRAADEKYEGKTLRVKGRVAGAAEFDIEKYARIVLFSTSQQKKTMTCYFDAARKKDVAGLKDWDTVEVQGIVASASGFITMIHCRLVPKK